MNRREPTHHIPPTAAAAQRQRVERSFAQHGARAYCVAIALTGDQGCAELAVIEAFRRLGVEREPAAPSRVEVMRATRRAARTLPGHPRIAVDPASRCPLYRGLGERELEVVALAVVGDCTCWEIAAMLGIGRDQVHHALRTGLAKVAANRDPQETVTP